MLVYKTKVDLVNRINNLMQPDFSLGFVPTMGALHQGHLSLVKSALSNNNFVVVSIFVNPTQFNSTSDLSKYPRSLAQDIKILETVSKDKILIYAPEIEDLYGSKVKSESFNFRELESTMEGNSRPGHFDGVGTIVKRLLQIVNPNTAYFGEKDFQQLLIIKKMVEAEGLQVKIIGCPTEREPNGLAMSSRNSRLSPEEYHESAMIYEILKTVKQKLNSDGIPSIYDWVLKRFNNNPLFELDYFQISDIESLVPVKEKLPNKKYRAFIAAYIGGVRLIDNIDLN
ncbi:MAG: pantoate--beta-alanine ligase [Algibacter sp.]|uniref:pantoate--beta-alanine ligase n=1 Tax=Algibacter sp. TaxID=1872428 RepID=UPI00261B14F7|nr:pantoate--beta-alanine ligase [Algibacter sp.]MDG1728925.1 pantoate--beta-alanine ligase [Algibacter sp.]